MANIIHLVPIMELPLLILMVLMRAAMLRRKGIKAVVFGVTDKTDFFLVPIIACFLYALTAALCGLPIPSVVIKPFWESDILNCVAIFVCTASLIWFAITLKEFGDSFRVGIDEQTKDKLVTTGTFALSRNPIYTAFIAFFIGTFLAYPNIAAAAFVLFIVCIIHRQILREERFLKGCYGEEYDAYCKRVRRYI